MSTDEMEFNSHSSLFTVYDAVHGAINLHDPGSKGVGNIIQLLNSPMVERLRRIKQLGYASHSYTAADHSRYAHAIGTMHMMRTILSQLRANRGIDQQVYEDLTECFPSAFPNAQDPENENILVRHMLVAALLQDVGELPYGKATSMVFRPSEGLIEGVKNKVGFDINDWSDKDIFTAACIHNERSKKILRELKIDKRVLVFLITGHMRDTEASQKSGLRQLRHMLDGEVDADRLDYVFRDAYHTVGGFGMPKTVIESLLYYDEFGPVFSDAGAVSDFLTLRAHLWTTVYFSPQNRFRMILLTTLLSGIKENSECAKDFFDEVATKGLSLKEFEDLDDISLIAGITKFYQTGRKDRLDERSKNALKILLGDGPEYECFWLPRPQSTTDQKTKIHLPDDLFFDTYSNFRDHSLYEPGSIRIRNKKFELFNQEGLLPLEECGGAFSPIFKKPSSALPMPLSYLLFTPKHADDGGWEQLYQAIEEGRLYDELMRNDPLMVKFPDDTCQETHFRGPKIFISFVWDDVWIIEKIVRVLLKKKRRYYLFRDAYHGIGDDTKTNSTNAVKDADAVLILLSVKYINRRNIEAPDGNIAMEIEETILRYGKEGLKPIFLSVDGYQEIEGKLPFTKMGYNDVPFVGEPLKDAPGVKIEQAVNAALKAIDENWQERHARSKK